MKTPHRLGSFLMGLLLLASPLTANMEQQSLAKRRFMADLDTLQNIFEVKYAPALWKQEFANWSLFQQIQEAKFKIENHPCLTLKEGQIILRDFFNSTKDYHVGVRFFSTESASLPFMVKGAEGRYFICHVDQELNIGQSFLFEEGDEIIAFDGRPCHDVINELREKEFGSNTFETDQALAELTLTQRRGDLGQVVPSGNVAITVRKRLSDKMIDADLQWYYIPEKISDFTKIGKYFGTQIAFKRDKELNVKETLSNGLFFNKMMVSHMWDKSFVGASTQLNQHDYGSRTSYIPDLGCKIWETGSDWIFDAYIFDTPQGKKVGYIRIPHFNGDEEEVEEFGQIMNFFQKNTEALVIDQINNPGGSAFYLYALAAILTDKPMHTPQHHIALTQEEVYIAHDLLPFLDQIGNDHTAQMFLGDTVGGYPVNYQFACLMKQFCHFLIQQWESCKLLSDATFLFGVDKVNPHPDYQYTKPILLLVNSLDFSGGDFFPAILQDSKRATIFGTRTAGAGGYIVPTTYPNHSGMKGFHLTGSIAERIDHRPLENLGVVPDIPYQLSVNDIQGGYQEYRHAIIQSVEALVESQGK
ncbi:MAG: hypothetical protein S4CHLAM123_10050 [Chlamydiales bacterium]|nr:hypothetical protein [Chlamydiales bacterium]